jgi:hypothetical protein
MAIPLVVFQPKWTRQQLRASLDGFLEQGISEWHLAFQRKSETRKGQFEHIKTPYHYGIKRLLTGADGNKNETRSLRDVVT